MDYVPKTNAELLLWLNNYKTKISTQGPVLGLSAAQITAEQNYCNTLIAAINDVELKKTALKASVEAKDTAMQTQMGALRTEIGRFKKAAAFTEAIGRDLGVMGSSPPFDAATYKAEITAELFGGFVRIKFKKKGAEGVNIYHRRKGTPEWKFLARDTKSPYDDHIVLETAGQPEHWEYRAYGVLEDAEIGLPSDIVEVVFGG